MATHSSVLAWITPGTAEPGGLPSVGSHRVGHDWSDLAAAAAPSASPVPSVQLTAMLDNLTKGLIKKQVGKQLQSTEIHAVFKGD